jgi:hypothetical protein
VGPDRTIVNNGIVRGWLAWLRHLLAVLDRFVLGASRAAAAFGTANDVRHPDFAVARA